MKTSPNQASIFWRDVAIQHLELNNNGAAMINLDENLGSATDRRAHVQAHGEIEEDFTGEVTRIDEDNSLTFVRHPDTGKVGDAAMLL